MGLFDKFKKNKNEHKESTGNNIADTEKIPDESDDVYAPGWDAITKECDKSYPNQTNPKHYHSSVPWILGGNDPLQGISVYDGGDY